jgi:archaeosine synthase beta-subunit
MPQEPTAERFDTQLILRLRPVHIRPEPSVELLGANDEWEASKPSGFPVRVRTLFLRGSECRFHCAMCDLWRYTYVQNTPPGAIPEQVRQGLADLASAASDNLQPVWLKLYNASSFFDSKNVPAQDLPAVAALVEKFERVIVENHPRLLAKQTVRAFSNGLKGRLEVAMGLETVEPSVLARLNKQMTLDDFQRAVETCLEIDSDVRAFVLLCPPWLEETAASEWCQRSIDFAIRCGVRHIAIIPVRGGNGALEWLAQHGHFALPKARTLETILQANLQHASSVVTADVWDWHQLRGVCGRCSLPRRTRIEQMNLYRQPLPAIECEACNAE